MVFAAVTCETELQQQAQIPLIKMKIGRDQHISESAPELYGRAAWPKHTLSRTVRIREGKRAESCPEGERKP